MGKVCCKIPMNNALQWSVKFRLLILIESFAFAIPHTHCKVKILILNIAICQYIEWEGLFQSTIRIIHSTVQEVLHSFISSKATFTTTTQHITTLPLLRSGQPGGRRWDVYLHCRKRTWQHQSHDQGAILFVIHDYQTSNLCRCKVQVEVVIRKSLPSWKANLATTQFLLAPISLCPVNLWWVW